MFEHYLAALLSLRQVTDPAYSSLHDASIRRDRGDRKTDGDPCPCRRWGIVRGHHHGCLALVSELFSQLDRELDAWEAAYGWLYR
jgi:hypothetical protein